MTTVTSEIKKETVIFGGTLGDAFITLCKLYSQHKLTGAHFRVIRYNLYDTLDPLIEEMFKITPVAEYIVPYTRFDSLDDLYTAIKRYEHPYVNVRWEADEFESYKFDYIRSDPFPIFQLPEVDVDSSHLRVGIQLHCGSHRNFRGFSIRWLRGVRNYLPKDKFSIYLMGTGAGCYDKHELESLCKKYHIVNLVGKTKFTEYMGHIKRMDYFISLEGFGPLFAMSQRVKTLLFNQYPHGVGLTVHHKWYENSRVIDLNSNVIKRKWLSIFNKKKLYSPGIPLDFFDANINNG